MYKIMIVEDEVFARIGLEQSIDWDALQLKLIPSASNGREALEIYRQFHPNIIVTDIKMPEMDGLELISAVRAEDRDVRFIILSCVEDYQTAKAALNLSVSQYYNKYDLDIAGLESYLREVVKELSGREDAGDGLEPPESTEKFWEKFFFDGGPQYTQEQLTEEGIPQQGTFFLVLLHMAIPEAMREDKGYVTSILRLLGEIVQKQQKGHYLASRQQKAVLLYDLSPARQESPFQQVSSLTGHLRQAMKSYFNIPVRMAVSRPFYTIGELETVWLSLAISDPGEASSSAEELTEVRPRSRKLLSAVAYIREHLAENLTLASVSKHINFSAAYLSSLFKQELNISFSDFVLELRMQQAQKLLLQSDEKLHVIAEQTGFYDASYFAKVFKRKTGMTPGEFRRAFDQGELGR